MIAKTKTTSAVVIQSGDSTHSQLQLITPTSFSVMKTMVRSPEKPIPPLTVLFLFSLIIHPIILDIFLRKSDVPALIYILDR